GRARWRHRHGGDGRGGPGGDDLDRPRSLETAQRRIQGAVRAPPQEPEGLAQALLELVSVQRLLLQQTEDGEFEHLWAPSRDGIYRLDISDGQYGRVNRHRQALRQSPAGRIVF